ncbi:unnamed protein product [Rotaria sp. Silwood1]|nr:unnamed protein product [Rotaria sp. Silwood1]CAF3347597.1 unnamed protein product [Rotaria sp. Silwood1]CAF4670557.1 unnamed protein product [Rotaria sp. Silwood1]CAF4743331.1 unnamed protein product [Rotaria sp. Silwood1]
MYETGDDHLHQEPKSTGINEQSKEVICELFKMKTKLKRILKILEEEVIPDDDDKPWVLKYQTEYEDEIDDDNDDDVNKFRFFVTTKILLFNATISNKIHADATYKLIWQEFPCFIIGTTDMIKQFHPYGFAVCSNEKEKDFEFIFNCIRDGLHYLNLQMNEQKLALIADVAEAISNEFLKVFEKHHTEDKNLHTEIMDDIDTLQLSKNKKTFEIAIQDYS